MAYKRTLTLTQTQVCEEAGYQQLEDLVMAYKRPDGEFATVTASATIEMLR